jgi:hypothetical protein
LLAGLPRIPALGFFPTAEAILAQILAFAVLAYGFLSNRRSAMKAAAPAAAE